MALCGWVVALALATRPLGKFHACILLQSVGSSQMMVNLLRVPTPCLVLFGCLDCGMLAVKKGRLYLRICVHVHGLVVGLVGRHGGRLLHDWCAMRHGGCRCGARTRRLRRVGVLLHTAPALVIGRHASPACIRTGEVPAWGVAHGRIVVLRSEVAAATTLALITTPTVGRTAVPDVAVCRGLRVASAMGALAHSDWVMLLHMTLNIMG